MLEGRAVEVKQKFCTTNPKRKEGTTNNFDAKESIYNTLTERVPTIQNYLNCLGILDSMIINWNKRNQNKTLGGKFAKHWGLSMSPCYSSLESTSFFISRPNQDQEQVNDSTTLPCVPTSSSPSTHFHPVTSPSPSHQLTQNHVLTPCFPL